MQIVGFDNIQAVRAAAQGRLDPGDTDQHDQLAVYGIEYALRVLDGAQAGRSAKTPVDLLVTADEVK
ncbi:MAG: hypothetical protein U0736_08670 [Gemmataceae bacterium]